MGSSGVGVGGVASRCDAPSGLVRFDNWSPRSVISSVSMLPSDSQGKLIVQIKNKQRILRPINKRCNPFLTSQQQRRDHVRSGIANHQPYDFGRVSSKETELPEIIVLGYDDEIFLGSIIPNRLIGLSAEFDFFDVGSAGKSIRQSRHKSTAQILVEQQLHPTVPEASRRSRAAAKA